MAVGANKETDLNTEESLYNVFSNLNSPSNQIVQDSMASSDSIQNSMNAYTDLSQVQEIDIGTDAYSVSNSMQGNVNLNNNPVVIKDMSIVGKLWCTQVEEEEDEINASSPDQQIAPNRYLNDDPKDNLKQDAGFTVVLSNFQKKKEKKKKIQVQKAQPHNT